MAAPSFVVRADGCRGEAISPFFFDPQCMKQHTRAVRIYRGLPHPDNLPSKGTLLALSLQRKITALSSAVREACVKNPSIGKFF